MNTWRKRGAAAVLFAAFMLGHSWLTSGTPNTVQGLLVFHGSAFAADAVVLVLCPLLLEGRLCTHMQYSCFASMVLNALGWAAYVLYVPGALYNWAMWALTAFQFIRLTLPDAFNGNSTFWKPVLRRGTPMGKALPSPKAKQ